MTVTGNTINQPQVGTYPNLTQGSVCTITNLQGPGKISFQLDGSYAGQLHVSESLSSAQWFEFPDATIQWQGGGSGAIPANGQGIFSLAVDGGTVYIWASALSAGSVIVTPQYQPSGAVEPGASGGGSNVNATIVARQMADGSGSIAAGGTAQALFGGAIPANGYELINTDPSNVIWVNDKGGTAAPNAVGSFEIYYLGGSYSSPTGASPSGTLSIYGAVTGQKFVARQW